MSPLTNSVNKSKRPNVTKTQCIQQYHKITSKNKFLYQQNRHNTQFHYPDYIFFLMIQKLQQIYDTGWDTNHGEQNNEIELESQEIETK